MALGQARHEGSAATASKFVPRTRILGRMRVVIANILGSSNLSSPLSGPLQKKHGARSHMETSNHLELLSEDVLVRILCKVNLSDLKQLLLVSKFVHRATLIAKEMHFTFSTPFSKPIFGGERHTGYIDLEVGEKAPNAPKQQRVAKSRLDRKALSSVAVALFTSSDEQRPKNGLATDM